VSCRLSGTWFTPLSHYALRWWFLVFLVELNLIGYDEISPLTWSVVIGSFLSFSCGALVPLVRNHCQRATQSCDHVKEGLRLSIDKPKFLRAIVVLFVMGIAAFCVYLFNVHRSFGILNFLISGQIVRIAISEGDTPTGFHYLYIMEMVGPLCFLYYLLDRKHASKWLFVIIFISVVSLLFTTGRTNMTKALVWIFYVYLFFEIQYLSIKKLTKTIGGLAIVIVGFFFLIGLWKHGTFATSDSRADQSSAPAASLMLPYFYMSVELPVLDKMLKDPKIEQEWGKYTFLPVVKVSKLFFSDIKTPSHIGEFYDTPLPANIATYLDLMYKDFWLIGPIALPALLGFFSSFFFTKLLFGRVSLSVFMINTVLAMTIFSSTSAANYMKPSYWFQVAVIILVSKFCYKNKLSSISNHV